MTLHAILLPIPPDPQLSGRQRVLRQREFARRALTVSASLSGAPATGWSQNANRVPLPNAGFYWSISHKPRLAAAVVSDEPVGIDVEALLPRRNELLWDRLADEAEWGVAGTRGWELFFRLWTAKEAALKSFGRGISGLPDCRIVGVIDEQQVKVQYEDATLLIEQHQFAGHIAAVTANERPVQWHERQP